MAAPMVTTGRQQIIKSAFKRIRSASLLKNFITGEFDIISSLPYLIPLIATDSMITLWKQKKSTIVGIIAITEAAMMSA